MVQWIAGVAFTCLVVFSGASANFGDPIGESLINAPGLAAVCGSSDKSWKKDKSWRFRCQQWSEAMNAAHLNSVYETAHESRI